MSNPNTFELLGDRAPTPCDISEAHGVAMAFMEQGTTVTPLPFRQPELLPTELRIRVTNAGLCHSDVLSVNGGWSPNMPFPMVPGHEIIGVVEKIGSAVTGYSEGDRVGFGVFRSCCSDCSYCAQGEDNCCPKKQLTYGPHFGGYATSFQAKASHFIKLPDSFPGQAAPAFCAGLTVYDPLAEYVKPGMKVAIGGIGGLGHLAIKFASKMGVDVTVLSTTPSKEDEARSYGAHHFANIR